MAEPARIVLGVGGGIAAYKAVEILRRLREDGHDVTVIPTESALRFVGSATWEALSGKPISTQVWDDIAGVAHVRIGQQCDLVVVAPATADLLARLAHGRADDLLAATLLTARAPVVLAPAMHTEMWQHPATVDNVALLRKRGAVVIDPAVGRLTGADSGVGRLPEPAAILEVVRSVLARGSNAVADLAGRHVVISAGGTREPIDPVRFIGNRSSGRQGYALAATAVARGARVTLISANVELPDPAGAQVVRVETALQLQAAVTEAAADADVVIMAAAVADFRPVTVAAEKLKKGRDDLNSVVLEPNPDILAGLVQGRRPGVVIVGFAAETGDEHASVLEHGRAKLASKGCDVLVVNAVSDGQGFGRPDNAATILQSNGAELDVPLTTKAHLADRVWDVVVTRLVAQGSPAPVASP